ncbi:hypothetical protein BC831DRAFT_442907 [Entophlyctis helioformis]|nr:hypothetical protein BC831DRAFT_442907 [Entophlyctis helioformis]
MAWRWMTIDGRHMPASLPASIGRAQASSLLVHYVHTWLLMPQQQPASCWAERMMTTTTSRPAAPEQQQTQSPAAQRRRLQPGQTWLLLPAQRTWRRSCQRAWGSARGTTASCCRCGRGSAAPWIVRSRCTRRPQPLPSLPRTRSSVSRPVRQQRQACTCPPLTGSHAETGQDGLERLDAGRRQCPREVQSTAQQGQQAHDGRGGGDGNGRAADVGAESVAVWCTRARQAAAALEAAGEQPDGH